MDKSRNVSSDFHNQIAPKIACSTQVVQQIMQLLMKN